ncbi:hypothetical protein ACVBEE_01610 [Acinetobacter sp. ANC 3781]
MPFLLIIWNNKRWTLIIVLLLCLFFQTWQVNSLGGDLRDAEIACDGRVAKALKPYIDAEKAAQEKSNEVSEQYEETREAERVRTEYITHTVQKIVEHPIYINNCFDTDGVSAVNSLIAGDSSKPNSTMP